MSKIETRLSPESSNIAKAQYDHDKKELTIEFKRGGEFIYSGVPESVWLAYQSTESVGKFFHAYIRNEYEGVKR